MISNSTSLAKINYKQPVQLWEQPASTSTYSGGVLNFSGSYSMYLIEFKPYGSSSYTTKMVIPLSDSTFFAGAKYSTSSGLYAFYVRRFWYVRNNSISISYGFSVSSFNSSDNTGLIPIKIWGIPE